MLWTVLKFIFGNPPTLGSISAGSAALIGIGAVIWQSVKEVMAGRPMLDVIAIAAVALVAILAAFVLIKSFAIAKSADDGGTFVAPAVLLIPAACVVILGAIVMFGPSWSLRISPEEQEVPEKPPEPTTEQLVIGLVNQIPRMSIQEEDPRFRPDLDFDYEVSKGSLKVFVYRRSNDPQSMVRLETRQSMNDEDCWGQWGVGNNERDRQLQVTRQAIFPAGIELTHDRVNNEQWMLLTQGIAVDPDLTSSQFLVQLEESARTQELIVIQNTNYCRGRRQ